ncbi:alpha-amylase family glycosyl hydrolase [Anaeromyxobacter oryzae]|uniref:Alpha-amylase n=1 Tax=Anaeromyxobacter oryzae TaxID=2918170 RepID=A0ABM7WUR4_9BACT|nr:alpha-amylase family glycosyl hydrolase [Anaeromyxobacter oryzae]BDG03237.1 alpha-amylase [Anaeromyxobacter oryzae]
MRRARTLALALLAALACATRPARPPPPPAASAAPAAAPAASARAVPDRWWDGAVFYEVFVRSFDDSDGNGMGDFAGLTAKLDYLNDGNPGTTTDLGVDALWLMPIMKSPSYHGYDVTDYEQVNPQYGTEAGFERFVQEAHRRGLRVILDLVLNHTSDAHPWFRESAKGPQSPKRDWYVWSPTDLGWTQPWNAQSGSTWHERNGAFYYGVFWGGMPDLNYRNPEVREEAKRIARFWLAKGVDGFRLDAIRHLIETGPGKGQAGSPENHVFLREFAAAVKAAKPDAMLVGEVWSDAGDIAEYYGDGKDELDMLFDFPLATAIVQGVKEGDPGRITNALDDVKRLYPPGAVDAPFLTNHDQIRVATQLGDDPARLRLAAAILLTLPGAPFLWQGEELGMQNGPGNEDEWKRTPMPWDGSPKGGFTTGQPWMELAPGHERANVAAETGDPGSLLSRYRALVRARHQSPALARGGIEVLDAGAPGVLAYLRRGEGETVLVVHGLGDDPVDVALTAPAAGAEPLLVDAGGAIAAEGGKVRVKLPARRSAIWRVR